MKKILILILLVVPLVVFAETTKNNFRLEKIYFNNQTGDHSVQICPKSSSNIDILRNFSISYEFIKRGKVMTKFDINGDQPINKCWMNNINVYDFITDEINGLYLMKITINNVGNDQQNIMRRKFVFIKSRLIKNQTNTNVSNIANDVKVQTNDNQSQNDYYIQPIYFTPGKKSNIDDLNFYKQTLKQIVDETNLSQDDKNKWNDRLQPILDNTDKIARDEPRDGSDYDGIAGKEKAETTAKKIDIMMKYVKDFYEFHTDREITIKDTISVVGDHSAIYYWTPRISTKNDVDQDAIVNKAREETKAKTGIDDAANPSVIYLYIIQGAGGWAGGNSNQNFGGVAGFGDYIVGCIDDPEHPDRELPRNKLPIHSPDWVSCNFNMATGTMAHELGHTFGLPHSGEFGCAGLSEYLVMETHWNFDVSKPGFMKNAKPNGNYGIMKNYNTTDCGQLDTNGANYKDGIGTPGNPQAKYKSELEILLDNPHFKIK